MSAILDALLAARVYESGVALRKATLRHTHLAEEPLGIVIWRLGGERFRAAAVAWGTVGEPYQLAVPGEPRNRDLYFHALVPFAQDLSKRIASAVEVRAAASEKRPDDRVPVDALQMVVANRTTVEALSLLGRYLGYLSDRGGTAPDPALIEAGRHLRFYTRRSRMPGQSLITPLDQLVSDHWATLQSPIERANLAALNAQINPPEGVHAFDAAALVEERFEVGPEPIEATDRRTTQLLEAFNAERAGSVDPSVVEPLLDPMRDHYRELIDPVWRLMESVVSRERGFPAAPSVARRWAEDRRAVGWHVDWVTRGGRYRTTETPRQAAMTLRALEEAQRRYEAERATEDPACMIPFLLDGDAIRGTVVEIDASHTVVERVRAVSRPRLVLQTDDPVVLPEGKQLWWAAAAGDKPWAVVRVDAASGGSRVELRFTTTARGHELPALNERATFSELSTGTAGYSMPLPDNPPWTHKAPALAEDPLDVGDQDSVTAPVLPETVPNPETYA
jgi:hypothetical protein